MVLAGVGDAIGFKNGRWEFCNSGVRIHEELEYLGGLERIQVNKKEWRVSDDTVMHIATAEALVTSAGGEKLYSILVRCYQECMNDMVGRAPEVTCSSTLRTLQPSIPFNPRGGGCGAAMRSAPIGLLFSKPEEINSLVAVSIESGRMTHNHPTGYLGALATALFVSYAIQSKPLREWGRGLLDTLDLAWVYVESTKRDVKENKKHWSYFRDMWTYYLKCRGILDGKSEPKFPTLYGVPERDAFYEHLSFDGTGGASGHDAPMIAYDALLSCRDSWCELCHRSMLHGGDSDSTGIIAGACWGAMYGYKRVPEIHYKNLEYVDRLKQLSKKLYRLHQGLQ